MKKSTLKISLFALFTNLKISIVGQLFVSELIAVFTFPYLKLNRILGSMPIFFKIGLGYLILLLSLMFSDLAINSSKPGDYMRGWATLVFSFFTIIYLSYLLKKDSKNIYYFLCFAALSFFLFKRELDPYALQSGQTNIFKIHFMEGVNYLVLVFALLSFKWDKKYPIIIFFIYAIGNIFLDSRSNGGMFFIAAVLLFVKSFDIKLTKAKIISLSFILIILFSFTYVFYINSILDGTISGDNTQQIKRLSNPYNPVALLEVGRAEFFAAIAAISEEPVFGYGSWAEDKTGKFVKMVAYAHDTTDISDSIIPSHSIILTAWLWAGIGGFLGCLLIYYILLKVFMVLFKAGLTDYMIIIIPLALIQAWNFLFSPFGHLRTSVPLFIAVLIVEYYNHKKNELKSKIN